MIDQILDRAMEKADGAQAKVTRSEHVPVDFQDDKLKFIKVDQSIEIELRVIADGREGYSSTDDAEDIDGLVKRALEAAEFGSIAHFEFPGRQEAQDVKVYDESLRSITKQEMVQIGEEMLALVKEYNPQITVSADVYMTAGSMQLANSSGLDFSFDSGVFGLGCGGQLVRGTDILEVHYGQNWRKRDPLTDNVKIADRVISKFRSAERTARISTGEMPVILAPEALNVLLMALKLGFSGKNVLLGASPLAGLLGSRIFDSAFTLIDDPLIDYASGSGSYDHEGVPRRVNTLVEGGGVKGFLYDLDTAGRAGTESTGNGPGCGTTNLVVAEGDTSYSDMVGNISEGLLVEDVIGLGQSNVMNGEFSVNVSLGYKIENGEIVGRVKDTMLTGNAYEALANIAAVGSDSEWVGGSLKAPPVQIEKLSVVSNT